MEQTPPQLYHLRPGLEFSPQQHQGKSFVVVKDPVTARYFRFTETQAVILELLRDPIDAPALASAVARGLGGPGAPATNGRFLKTLQKKRVPRTAANRPKHSTLESPKTRDPPNNPFPKNPPVKP